MLLPRGLWADDKPADPNYWVWLSDTHIWEERNKVHRGTKPAINFGIVRRDILALPKRPSAAIVTGDCAFSVGNAGDYAVLAEEVKPLREAGMSLHFAFGNHDERTNFPAAFAEVRQEKPPVVNKFVTVVETPHANLILLDSLLKTKYTPGELGQPQLDWLAKTLDARADKPAVVMAHHDPDNGLGSGLTRHAETVRRPAAAPARQGLRLRPHAPLAACRRRTTCTWSICPPPRTSSPKACRKAGSRPRWPPAAPRLVLHSVDPKHEKHGEKFELKWRAS